MRSQNLLVLTADSSPQARQPATPLNFHRRIDLRGTRLFWSMGRRQRVIHRPVILRMPTGDGTRAPP